VANPDFSTKAPRDSSRVVSIDGDRLAVLENRLAELEGLLQSPQLHQVETMARVIKAMNLMLDDAAARLEWYAKAGQRVRDLFADLVPEDDGMELPTLGSALAAATGATSKSVASQNSGDGGDGLPPSLKKMLEGLGVKL